LDDPDRPDLEAKTIGKMPIPAVLISIICAQLSVAPPSEPSSTARAFFGQQL
jgi:hypothetical protein